MRFSAALFVLGCLVSMAGAQSCVETSQLQAAPTSARAALEQMSPVERKNSHISVEFDSSGDDAIALGHEVERLWNDGQYDEALAQLGDLEGRVGQVAIGNSWHKPVPTVETGLWDRDVRIGNRDLILDLACVADDSTGNLIVVLRRGGPPHYSVCMSIDTGATWCETFTWVGSPPTAIDAGALGGHFYVMYNSPGENARQVRARRFLCSDGQPDTFRNGKTWVVASTFGDEDTMREASLVTDPDNAILYLISLVSDGSIRISSAYLNGVPGYQTTAIASGASSGLDGADNRGSPSRYCFFTYYDTSDTLRIYCFTFWGDNCLPRRRPYGLALCFSQLAGSGTPTSISAYRDTVICAYEDETSSPRQVRYATRYGDGDTWTIGTLSNVDTAAEYVGVTAIGGGGFASVFRHGTPTCELRFRQRTDNGPWSDPVSVADNEPCPARPAIEYLGAGVYGVVYLSNSDPVVRGAFFDRSDWPYGLAGQRRPQASSRASLATVVRRVLFLPRDMTETSDVSDRVPMHVLLDISGRKVMNLTPGANDVRALAPGVYFVREEPQATSLKPQAVRKIVLTR
jgi:hypothetical protein